MSIQAKMQKNSIINKAKVDGFRGDYVSFGGLHLSSLLIGFCAGGLFVYTVWFFTK